MIDECDFIHDETVDYDEIAVREDGSRIVTKKNDTVGEKSIYDLTDFQYSEDDEEEMFLGIDY